MTPCAVLEEVQALWELTKALWELAKVPFTVVVASMVVLFLLGYLVLYYLLDSLRRLRRNRAATPPPVLFELGRKDDKAPRMTGTRPRSRRLIDPNTPAPRRSTRLQAQLHAAGTRTARKARPGQR